MTKLKALFILGPGQKISAPDHTLTKLKKIYQQSGYKLIGDGNSNIKLNEIYLLKNKIDFNTRIDIHAHGIIVNGQHSIALEEGAILPTRNLLSILNEQSLKTPLYVNLWSCYSGSAVDDVEYLSENSILVSHGSHEDLLESDLSYQAQYAAITNPKTFDKSISPFQKIMNELITFASIPYMISFHGHEDIPIYRVNYDLETVLENPETYLKNAINKFAEFYQSSHPGSEELQLPNQFDSIFLEQFKYNILINGISSQHTHNQQLMNLLEDKNKESLYKDLFTLEKVNGLSLIITATFHGNLKVVQLLLDANIDTEIRDVIGLTPLYVSVQKNHIEVARLLLEYKADANAKINTGTTSLFLAVANKQLPFIELLLDNGADPDYAYPLLYASIKGYVEVAKLLLEYGADPDIETPLLKIASKGSAKIVKLLLEYGANPNVVVSDISPLFLACTSLRTDIIKILLEFGAGMHTKYGSLSAYDYAKSLNNKKILDLFNQEIELRKAIEAKTPFCFSDEAKLYLQAHASEVYTAIKCRDDSKPIYKYIDNDDTTMICEYLDSPRLHEEL